MLLDCCSQSNLIRQIDLFEWSPLYGRFMSTEETIYRHGIESLCRQRLTDMTADITGSTGYQNGLSQDHAFLSVQARSVAPFRSRRP